MEPLGGIGEADARLGRVFPLPTVALPLSRWTEVHAHTGGGVEVEWNLDDTRPGAPGRLALYAGPGPDLAPSQLPDAADEDAGDGLTVRRAALAGAQESLRPALELRWKQDGLSLRLTAQGPWGDARVLALARSVRG